MPITAKEGPVSASFCPIMLLILACPLTAATSQPAICGFGNDNSGVWPTDCTPVATWNEADFKKMETGKDGKGRPVLAEYFDKENLLTGKTPKETRAPWAAPHHPSALAGPQLLTIKLDGICGSFGLDAQRFPDDSNGINRLGLRGFKPYDCFNEGFQPPFSGNRVFIHSYSDVYCLGDPTAAMQLSASHR